VRWDERARVGGCKSRRIRIRISSRRVIDEWTATRPMLTGQGQLGGSDIGTGTVGVTMLFAQVVADVV
jgi:hypothetical protein